MSKVKSDQLFNLIKSLSKGEKRFFKLYASRLNNSEDRKFIVLFDAIDKQKVYSEEKILDKERTLNPKQISNLKAHLYYQILKSVRLLNSAKVEDLNLITLLDYARLLYNKCLYKECIKMIDKVKLKAMENDRSLILLDALELEKLVIPKTIEAGNQNRVNDLINTTNLVAESIQNINVFSNLSLKLNSFYVQTGFSKSKEDLLRVKRFFFDSLPAYNEENLSFQEKLYLYQSYIGYSFFIQNLKEGYYYSKKLVLLFEEFPEMKRHKPENYIKALNNLLVVLNKLQKYDEFVSIFKQLVSIKRDKKLMLTENINLNLFKTIYIHEINRHFMNGEFISGVKIVNALESELEKFIPRLDKHSILLFYYKIACLFIGSEDFKSALKWLNKIYHEKEIDVREDILSFTRILLLVCHFELNNDGVLESSIRSTYRYFMKKGPISEYQRNILNFLRIIFLDPSEKNLNRQFKLLKEQMLILENQEFEKRAFMYFDIVSWLESKLQKRSIESVIKEKIAFTKGIAEKSEINVLGL